MPTLPTIDVSAAQKVKVMEAFPATDTQTSVEVYQAWLREQVRLRVLQAERTRMEDERRQAAYDREAALATLRNTLP